MLLQAVVSIVVANMLVPLDLGIMAVLTVFTALAQVVVDSGFSQTLIRKADPTDGDYKAVFRFNVITSIVLYALLTALSPVAARYYGWPELARVAPVLFLLLPVKRTVRHTEHHHGARIPFRAALGHNLCGIARERYRRRGHGGKRLRRMESRRTAGEHDGRKGRVAVDSQSVAAARGMQGLLTRRDGSVQSATYGHRPYHGVVQQYRAAVYRQNLFGRRFGVF